MGVFKKASSRKATAWRQREREQRERVAAAAGPAEKGTIAHQNEHIMREDAHSEPPVERRVRMKPSDAALGDDREHNASADGARVVVTDAPSAVFAAEGASVVAAASSRSGPGRPVAFIDRDKETLHSR